MIRSAIAGAALLIVGVSVASAATVVEKYNVMSYAPNQHSLYMNGQSYHFQSGAMFTRYSDDTGTLMGTATNNLGDGYDVKLSFANFRNWTQQQAAGLGAKGAGLGDKTTWTFMDLVDVSTLTGVGTFTSMYELLMKPQNGPYTFQYGVGANDKQQNVLGLSGWFFTKGPSGGPGAPCGSSSVCDFNLKLTAVPLPAGIALLPIGLAVLAGARMRRRKAA
ncbi:VPLPA-CTERM sorting domain-containing protein [Roseibium sp.]|uniref:VPLPA-CTERM sorting domain-containing protein n=1 Tax=Roseibium sp. TaxID=1936156 RepID=UPI003BAA45EF